MSEDTIANYNIRYRPGHGGGYWLEPKSGNESDQPTPSIEPTTENGPFIVVYNPSGENNIEAYQFTDRLAAENFCERLNRYEEAYVRIVGGNPGGGWLYDCSTGEGFGNVTDMEEVLTEAEEA